MNPKMVPWFVALIAVLVGWMAWSGDAIEAVGIRGIEDRRIEVQAMEDSLVALRAETDSVKRLVASGRVEELRARIESYRGSLQVMRQFVPERSEVPDLIDDINSRAKIRGVQMAVFNPEPVATGPAPYDTYSYNLAVVGRYDQVGHFLTDIASLSRIIVPQDVRLAAAPAASGQVLGDTSRALLEARFRIRTFVKSGGTDGP
jgi:type IV pilus assembly protein PilO